MKLGIIGLPNSGKTTIFNALTGANRPTGASSSGKLEVVTAVVSVPDVRIDKLSAMYKPKKTIFATITYTDIGGLEKGISSAGGISGELRNHLQQVEGFIHVVRAFQDDTVPHPQVTVDPIRDLEAVDGEFVLADLVTVERRLERMKEERGKTKIANPTLHEMETELLNRFKTHLDALLPLRDLDVSAEESRIVRGYGLLTLKPVLVLFNAGETPMDTATVAYPHRQSRVASLQGKIEAEIAQLSGDDQTMFLAEYHIAEPGAQRVIRESYELLHIQSFFTVGPDEVRAWTIPIGATAQESAGVIHSDLARGFIRAEVTPYLDLLNLGSEAEVKKQGKMRLEGKEYVVKDGDIVHIRANV